MNIYLSDYFFQTHRLFLLENKLFFGCCDRHHLDQTSTLGGRSLVETSTKLRHPTCRNFDQTSTKLRPNFDTHIVQNILFYPQNILFKTIDYFFQQPFNQIIHFSETNSLILWINQYILLTILSKTTTISFNNPSNKQFISLDNILYFFVCNNMSFWIKMLFGILTNSQNSG